MKKVLASLFTVLLLMSGISLASFAASPSADSVKISPSASSASTSTSTSSAPASSSSITIETEGAQTITGATLDSYAKDLSIASSVEGATIGRVLDYQAITLVNAVANSVSKTAKVMAIVDVQVPEGTGKAQFTLSIPGLAKGMNVSIIHQKSDGTLEFLNVDSVGKDSVTFTMTSYSPIIVAVNATSPKTMDMSYAWIVATLSAVILGGAAFVIYKRRRNI